MNNMPQLSGYQGAQLPQYTPQQMQLFQSLLSQTQQGAQAGTQQLNRLAGGDESMFQQLEAPAYSAFDKLSGQIGSRFSGMGARNSSAFRQSISGAAGDLAQNLQSQRLGLQQGAIDKLLNQSNQFLSQRPFENVLLADQAKTDWGALIGQLGPSIINLLGNTNPYAGLMKLFGGGQ